MRKKIKPYTSPLGPVVHEFGVSAHRVVNNNVESTLSFFGENGTLLSSRQAQLTEAQYKKWTHSITDDEAFFFECHLENCSFVLDEPKHAAAPAPAKA